MHRARRIHDVSLLRVLIVDAHEVSLGACTALLRTEGLAVAGVAPGDHMTELAWTFKPNVVLIDPVPELALHRTLRQLRSVACVRLVLVISSAEPERLDPLVRELPFLPKADLCAEAIIRAVSVIGDERGVLTES
jgi:CheY-like chemotaxis protein